MATTKGAVTTFSSSQMAFLPVIEDPENSRINFRDSLKFFQEQLVINGANFPSPSSGCQSAMNTLKKNGSFLFKENDLDKSSTATKEKDALKEEIHSVKSCTIAIPTVDTILESVRVLRAIQKSQEERGSFWNLDVSTKTDIDSYFRNEDDEVLTTNENQNGYSNQEPDVERNDETDSLISVDKQAQETLIGKVIAEAEIEVSSTDANIKNNLTSTPNSTKDKEICFFWPTNSLAITSYSETEQGIKDESPFSLDTKNQYANPEYKTGRESTEVSSTTESSIKSNSNSDEKQNDNRLLVQLEKNGKNENKIEISKENESKIKIKLNSEETQNDESLSQMEEIDNENLLENTTGNGSKLKNDLNSGERQNNENFCKIEQNDNNKNLLENPTENVPKLKSEQNSDERRDDNDNVIELEQKNNQDNQLKSTENEFKLKNGNFNDDQNSNEISAETEQSDMHTNSASEIFIKDKIVNKNTITEVCDKSESSNEVCTDLQDFINFNQDGTKETLLNELKIKSELLKIETYEDTDTHKPDVFMLNESLWKDERPHERSSMKTEHNDSDSGFGTQRSGSSLSPNNHSQMQKDSWSDGSSSHYASAECSPYHSLNSVFETSLGFNTQGETKATENTDISSDLASTIWEDTSEKVQDQEKGEPLNGLVNIEQTNNNTDSHLISDKNERDSLAEINDLDFDSGNAELDTEISYCNFITNYTIENPCKKTDDKFQTAQQSSEICDNPEKCTAEISNNSEKYEENISKKEIILHKQTAETNKDEFLSIADAKETEQDDDLCDLSRTQKFTATSCDLIAIVQSLYTIKENPAYQILHTLDEHEKIFEEELFILSRGAFCEFPEDYYLVTIDDSTMNIKKDSQVLCSLIMKYVEVSIVTKSILEIDNKMGKCVYIQSDTDDLVHLKTRIETNILKNYQTDCLQLVHYPLKCHQNVVIIDLGSSSTRAGILMDQPTLPSLFFPTICATKKTTGTNVYGMEALQSEVRQHSNLSFPVRPTIKITKHTIDIELVEGLFKKIFSDLKIYPTEYMIQVCLPRNLSINAQTALMKLLLEDLKVKAVSLTNQALLTLYAHEVSTAVVVDIGDRIDVLPVVDGFIVENGVTKLPHGGQRLIHHMKHGLAEQRISLSNDIDSFVVQYIIENLAYVAEDYEKEMQIATKYPNRIKKTVTLQPASSKNVPFKTIALDEARFKIHEGLFNPDLWGLDSPGIHHLVQKAIQAAGVDARKQIAENIYVSGGVTMLPGFVERLSKEMIKLSKTKVVPKVHASNYRYHCTFIGACKFAKMDVFPQVCVNLEDYSRNGTSVLKKCALCF